MWIKSKDVLPQINEMLYLWINGKKEHRKVDGTEIYDGQGGLSKDLPEY